MALLGNIVSTYTGTGSVFDAEAKVLFSGNLQRIRFGKSRRYLDDYARFSSVFSLKNIVVQATKGACLPLIAITKELEVHNKEMIAATNRGEIFDKEFDWDSALKRQWPVFRASTQRFYITSLIRRSYDLYLILNFSPKFVDHLCKDFSKSAVRKLQKFGRFGASARMVKTTILSSFLNYFSSLTYDCLLMGYEFSTSKQKKFDIIGCFKWICKRSLYYTVLLLSSSIGFSFGTLIGDRGQVVSTILALVGETMAAETAGRYLL